MPALYKDGKNYSHNGPKVDVELTKGSPNAAPSGQVYDKIEEIQKQIIPTASLDDASYVGSDAEDYFRLTKIGNVVFVSFRKMETTSSKGKINIKELPTELIPKNEQMFDFAINDNSTFPTGIVKNDGYLYSGSNMVRNSISSDFFYFLD